MAQATIKNAKPKKSKWFRYLIDFLIIMMLIIAFRSWQQRSMVSGVAPEIQGVLMDGTIQSLKNTVASLSYCIFGRHGVLSVN